MKFAETFIHKFWKNKTETVGIIILISVLLSSVGGSFSFVMQNKENEKKIEQLSSIEHIFYTSEWVDDASYYLYLHENKNYANLKTFLDDLYHTKEFTFISQIEHQGIIVKNREIPDVFLEYYEQGNADYSISEVGGNTEYSVKALNVSLNFFSENNIYVATGRTFDQDDYFLEEGDPIPVLLGSDYEGIFQIGDSFSGSFFASDAIFEVIGFLDSESFFLSRSSDCPISTRRYIITPVFLECETCDFSHTLRLQSVVGQIRTKQSNEYTATIYQEIKNQAGLQDFNIFINELNNYNENMWNDYIFMTKEISLQYKIILGILVLVTIIAIYLTLSEKMEETMERYGIQMLLGCSRKKIEMEIDVQIVLLIEFGNILSMIIMSNFIAQIAKSAKIIYFAGTQLIVILLIIVLSLLINRKVKNIDIKKSIS